MPDPYQNPPNKPPVGGYKWVPETRPTGGAVPIGFRPATVERGKFRNDLPVQDGYADGSLTISVAGEVQSLPGSQNWPIYAAFRYKSRPSSDRGVYPDQPFVVSGADLKWQADLRSTSSL